VPVYGRPNIRSPHDQLSRIAYSKHTLKPFMNKKVVDPESCPREEPKDLKLLELLIDKSIKRLEEDSYEPKIQDALKAIQLKEKVAKTSEAEKTFWQLIDDLRREELGPTANKLAESTCSERSESKHKHEFCVLRSENLEAQILNIIVGLKHQVKNGILPVKTITDAFNQGRSKESQLTYPRIGRLLSTMGFRKAKTQNGSSAIIWDDNLLSQNTFSNAQNSCPQDG